MMLACVIAIVGIQAATPVGNQPESLLAIYHRTVTVIDPAKMQRNERGEWAGAPSYNSERVGYFAWSMTDSKFEGAPCKLFKGDSTWRYRVRRGRNVPDLVFNPKIYVNAWLSPAGKLLRMTTAYAGIGLPIQTDATFKADGIELTMIAGKTLKKTTLYPANGMDKFDHFFEPFTQDGLVTSRARSYTIIHPLTGAPLDFSVTEFGQFRGKMLDLPHEGHKFKIWNKEGAAIALVSRQGQLLQVNLPRSHDAVYEVAPSNETRRIWGRFQSTDWEKPSSKAHPQRPRLRTLMVPVVIDNPLLIVPVPVALALP